MDARQWQLVFTAGATQMDQANGLMLSSVGAFGMALEVMADECGRIAREEEAIDVVTEEARKVHYLAIETGSITDDMLLFTLAALPKLIGIRSVKEVVIDEIDGDTFETVEVLT
jgi:hypothetical protein